VAGVVHELKTYFAVTVFVCTYCHLEKEADTIFVTGMER
jgi:hypothetical protein